MASNDAFIGLSDHCGWAVLVTVAGDGEILDRRRIELVDSDLPSLPYHHPCQRLPLDKALALVDRVQASAERRAGQGLHDVERNVGATIRGIAMRECPKLPPTVAERIQSYWAQTRADSVMYRQALADAARTRGWSVHWYKPKTVFDEAADALGIEDTKRHFEEIRKRLGPPWNQDHRLAMAGAIVASAEQCNA